ncbi:MAG: NADH-quinone oxidoreductase subunit L [Candidatus Thermoplasmatota archaeon]|nr:NADH-quinone oxidoreductase subunit L [Candidatus Thermoplasmatota archaeon]MEC7416350.1 NADH-quinone oxidoreductase subunit L [Candidatus Thermoplasmatota archaeon]MEC7697543.1 NADH-quinone oxidoreductase subunit L [Candidatus Thermoplasmatota archaeon]MEC8216986.1 NADH-quinone oxidoreductase subunit L [Candidatus Thermoplasmatota archaeon]MEC9138281.1 NADH-quinone oxidoreductase subunit L [Candidatus Thermoplasmatota archaeon]
MGETKGIPRILLNKIGLFLVFAISLLAYLLMSTSESPVHFSWMIPVFPLVSFALILLFGLQDSEKGGSIALFGVSFSSVFSIAIAYDLFVNGTARGSYIESTRVWFSGSTYSFEFGTYIDSLAGLLLLVVGIVSYLVVLFSISYMDDQGNRRVRYFAEISLFIAAMYGLVVANSFLLMFIFWELMGVCSYLLIGFWYEKPSAASAAKKAFLVTRVGDVFLLLGLVIMYNTFGTLRYSELFADPQILMDNLEEVKWATLCLFGGSVGKSAQFPLHVWLPDAMEGPTTVSALIHAATMVKAGVFLVARAFPLIVHSPDTAIYIAFTGGLTALIAASMAMVMNDIKRVLAYSTISQLGYMFLALGAGAWAYWHSVDSGLDPGYSLGYMAGLFHLMNHAFFKALLFLGSGAVIHAVHTQDMREMGGLRKEMPITSITMGLGVLSIAGVPFFSGFWSKDEILVAVNNNAEYEGIFGALWFMALLTAGMTAFYMTRMWMMTFSGPSARIVSSVISSSDHSETGNWVVEDKKVESHAHEAPLVMTLPLMVLSLLAVFSGLTLVIGGGFSSHVFYGEPYEAHGMIQWSIIDHILSSSLTYLSVTVGLTGIFFGIIFYKRGPDGNSAFSTDFIRDVWIFRITHTFLSNRLYMSDLFNWFGMRTWDTFAQISDWFDRNIIDGIVNKIASLSLDFSNNARNLTTGFTGHYASLTVGGLGALVLLTRIVMPIMGWSI